MELRIIFMIISTFSGSAALQNPPLFSLSEAWSTAGSGQDPELLLQAAGDCRPNLGPALLKTLRRK